MNNMNTKIKLLALAVLALSITSCMEAPKGDRAETGDVFSVNEKIKGIEFNANIDKSTIEWLGTKPTGTHFGTVGLSDGKIFVDKNKVTGGTLVIDLNSIEVHDIEEPALNDRLLGHLKSADFFYVDSFPTATFQIASLEKISDAVKSEDGIVPTHLVKGNLTMRGITKGITFPAAIEVKDNLVYVESSQFMINRTNWNVNYGSKSIFAELKDNFIHDEMGIKIEFVAEK